MMLMDGLLNFSRKFYLRAGRQDGCSSGSDDQAESDGNEPRRH